MTSVFLFDAEGGYLTVEDPMPAQELKDLILRGIWAPRVPKIDPTFSVLIIEGTIIVKPNESPSSQPVINVPKLSDREWQVLQGLVDWLQHKEIAGKYGMSRRMVREHQDKLKMKFNTLSPTKIAALAVSMGICQPTTN